MSAAITVTAARAYPAPPGRPAAPVRAAHHAGLRPEAVLAAVEAAGAQLAGSQLEVLNEALAWLSVARVRAEFREKLEKFIRIHVLHMSWGGAGHPPRGVTSPGRERVCRLAGMSVSSAKRCRRWWEKAGFLVLVQAGWTPAIHPGLSAKVTRAAREKTLERLREQGRDKNLTAAYALCVPSWPSKKAFLRSRGNVPAVSGPLTFFCSSFTFPSSPAGENPGEGPVPGSFRRPGSPATAGKAARDDGTRWPGLLGQVTARTARRLTGPLKAAGWTDPDILHGLNRTPAGAPHLGTADSVRNPAAVAWWRLAHWRRPDGTLLPSPSQRAAASACKTRAEQQASRAAREALEQAAARNDETDRVTPAAAAARDLLARHSQGAAAQLARQAVRAAAPQPRTAPGGTASARPAVDSAIAVILARRAARPSPAPPPPSAAGTSPVRPVPGYLQAAISQAVAAVEAVQAAVRTTPGSALPGGTAADVPADEASRVPAPADVQPVAIP